MAVQGDVSQEQFDFRATHCVRVPQSTAGCRFVERMLTVVQTRRLPGCSVPGYLDDALVAHRRGRPAPSLLSAE